MKLPLIGIIGGKGKMGAYFARYFEDLGCEVMISDRGTKLSNAQVAKKADIVIVSVPIEHTEVVIKGVVPHVRKGALLMDMTSVKQIAMNAMKGCKGGTLGFHPIFGPSTKSLRGQVIILSPGKSGKWTTWLTSALKASGADLQKMSAKKHDEMMAYVQAMLHFTSITMASTLSKSGIAIEKLLASQSPVYSVAMAMMGRYLNQDAKLYRDIQMYNPETLRVTQQFLESADTLAAAVMRRDGKAFERVFRASARYFGKYTVRAQSESDAILDGLKSASAGTLEASPKRGEYDLAVLGPRNTYSDQAAQQYDKGASVYYARTIAEVFELVSRGTVPKGLVPLENSTSGSVRETLDELFEQKVWMSKRVPVKIELALLGLKGANLKGIKQVYSHAQPLLQSRKTLKAVVGKAKQMAVSSTAKGIERLIAEGDKGVAVVASKAAAKAKGLKVLKAGIEDVKGNTTQFAVIERAKKSVRAHTFQGVKTSIAFTFAKDKPGSLAEVLADFAEAKVNMTKIESRPNGAVKGEFVFYIDFDGRFDSAKAKGLLRKLKGRTETLKVLGCA